jgi:hypothetical protein
VGSRSISDFLPLISNRIVSSILIEFDSGN